MKFRFAFPAAVRGVLLVAAVALSPRMGLAQAAPASVAGTTYDFLTVTTSESNAKALAVILFAPSFQGKSEIPLEDFSGVYNAKNRERLQRNTVLINQQLSELTAAGWELFQVYPLNYGAELSATRYLFRKVRR